MIDTPFVFPVTAPPFHPISRLRSIKNDAAAVLFVVAFLIALVPLVWVLYTVITRGVTAITNGAWWTQDLGGVRPNQVAGGVAHAIYGTIVQAGIAAVLAVPLGVMAAVYLVEYGRGRFARVSTVMVDVLAGVPSIVAALFIFALWIASMGFPQSALAVSLALVLLMLPVVVRNTEEMLKLVPDELREASYALGIPMWKTIVRVVVPTALPGIVSGIMLAQARVIGETAPVLVLVGYARRMNSDVFQGNMASLPLLIYTELINPQAAGRLRVWGAALTLIVLVTVLYTGAALITRWLGRNRA
jgi:phosphate transport system permease protein